MDRCPKCDDEGWVCENHPEKAWAGGNGCCGGAGAPCKCSPLHRDNWSPDTHARHIVCDVKNAILNKEAWEPVLQQRIHELFRDYLRSQK